MWTPEHARGLLGLSQTGDLGPFTIYTSQRRKPVWFTKSPPQKPPSPNQVFQRSRFTTAAAAWQAMTQAARAAWALAARRAGLYVTGYNLWVWWQLKRDRTTLATIERNSGVTLIQP